MKTAMQELIEDFTELAKKEGDSGFVGRSVLSIIKNKKYLEKEKEQIENAYIQGFCHCEYTGILDSKKYFKDTFKN